MNEFVSTQENVLETEPAFRRVLATGAHSQIVSMTLQPQEEIGSEVHDDGDQIFMILSGWPIEVTIDAAVHSVSAGAIILVPQGVRHNVANLGSTEARVLTVYAPAQHEDGFVALTKAEADHEHKH